MQIKCLSNGSYSLKSCHYSLRRSSLRSVDFIQQRTSFFPNYTFEIVLRTILSVKNSPYRGQIRMAPYLKKRSKKNVRLMEPNNASEAQCRSNVKSQSRNKASHSMQYTCWHQTDELRTHLIQISFCYQS